MSPKIKNAAAIIFAIYCGVMIWLLFDRSGAIDGMDYWQQVRSSLNLVPGRTISMYLRLLQRHRLVQISIVNLAGNIVMFIPLGFFLPMQWQKLNRFYRTLLATVLIISIVEITQLLTLLGSCDIDDLILNLLGVTLGYLLFLPAKKRLS